MNAVIRIAIGNLVFLIVTGSLVFFVIWLLKAEFSETLLLIGDLKKTSIDANQTLGQLVMEAKLISAKDFFGFYISYYNNFVLVLTGIISLYGITSFFYFKDKNEKNMREVERKTLEEIQRHLAEQVDLKKTIKEVIDQQVELGLSEFEENFKREIDKIKENIDKIKEETQVNKNDGIGKIVAQKDQHCSGKEIIR